MRYYLDALNNLGTIFYSRKRYPEALDYYRKALKISSGLANRSSEYRRLPVRNEALR